MPKERWLQIKPALKWTLTLAGLELVNVCCPHCRQTHQMAGIEYSLIELGLPEPLKVNEDIKAA